MNALEIGAIVIIICSLLYGRKRGLVGMLLPLVANIVTILLLCVTKSMWKEVFFEWVLADIQLIFIRIVVIVILYGVIVLAFKFVFAALKIITSLPLVKQGNRLLGFAAGLIQGLLIIWTFLAIVQIAANSTFGMQMLPMIEKSVPLSFLYKNNLITYVVYDLIVK